MPIDLNRLPANTHMPTGTSVKRHTLEQIIHALTLLSANAGNYNRTIIEIAETEPWTVKRETLKRWAERDYAQEYTNIREKHKTEYEAEMVRKLRDRIKQADDLEERLMQSVSDRLGTMSLSDAYKAAFNVARIKDENINKLLLMTGRPGQIIEKRTLENAIDTLVARKILKPTTQVDNDTDDPPG